jgi:large subunit ribosomal protein L7/L12
VQAKKFVEEAPKVLREAASKDEAAKIKADLEKLGAKISVE